MAEIKIGVAIDKSGLQKAITDLNTSVSKASVKPIEIKLKVDGSYKNVTSDLIQLATAQARLEAAQARAAAATARNESALARQAVAAAKVTAAEASLAASKEKTAQAEARLRQEQEKTAQAAISAAGRIALEQEKANTATVQGIARAAAEQEKANTAAIQGIARVAVEREKANTEAEKGAARVAVEQEKANTAAAQGAARVATEQSKAYNNAIKGAANLLIAQERTAQGALKLANNLVRVGSDAGSAAGGMDTFAAATMRVSESLTSMVKRTLFNAIRREIRETISTMREMDSQLTTIKRVAGISEAEASRYQSQAYEMGSKYGVKPGDYLADVVAFTRAGYGDLAPQLGELATKMQVVGEVSQETATQMMLSVDAAYKYEGNTEKLSRVIDGANEIGDHYATNLEKIAQGLGIVAPVAKTANVGIDELTAAIGTITAVTQRSGSEAARALRYMFINLAKDTKTEVEEGVTVSEEEITGLHDLVMEYASDDTVKQMVEGQIVNPMKVIKELHESVANGLITEQELLERVTKFSGKLRASQVLALVNNYDMYSGMLETFANAAGSADTKVEVVLTSWESKANMLSASFTKLFSDVLGSNVFKGGLDALTGLTKFLDIGDGAVARVAALAAAFVSLSAAINGIAQSQKFASLMTLISNPYTLAIGAGGLAIGTIVELLNANAHAQENREQLAERSLETYNTEKTKLQEINTELEKQRKIIDELTTKQAGEGGLTAAESERLRLAREYTKELEIQQKLQQYTVNSAKYDAATSAVAAMSGLEYFDIAQVTKYTREKSWSSTTEQGINNTVAWYRSLLDMREKLTEDQVEEFHDIQANITEAKRYMAEYRRTEKSWLDEWADYYDYAKETHDDVGFVAAYEKRLKAFKEFDRRIIQPIFGGGETTGGETPVAGATGTTGGGKSAEAVDVSDPEAFARALAHQRDAYIKLKGLQQEYNENNYITKDTLEGIKSISKDLYEGAIEDAEGYKIKTSDLEKALKGVSDWFDDYGEELPDFAEAVAESAFADIASDVLKLADAAGIASKALEELKKNLKAEGETGDTFDAYASEFGSVKSLAKEKNWGSKELRGFLALAMDQEALAGAGTWSEAYKQFSEGFGGVALGDTTGRKGLAWLLKNRAEIVDANGEIAASFAKTANGYDIFIGNSAEAAKALGVTEDVFVAWAEKMGLYQDAATDTINKNKEVGDSAEQAADSVNTAADETAKAAETMDEATGGEGKPGEGEGTTIPVQVEGLDELQRVLGVLTDATGARHQVYVAVMTDGSQQIYDLDGKLHEMAEGETVETEFTAKTDNLREQTEQAEQYITTVYENGNRTVELVGDAESVKKAAEEAAAAVGEVPEEKETNLEGDASSATEAAGEAGQAVESVPETRETRFGGAAFWAISSAEEAKSAIESVPEEHNTDFTGDATGTQDASNEARSAVDGVEEEHTTEFNGDDDPLNRVIAAAIGAVSELSGQDPEVMLSGNSDALFVVIAAALAALEQYSAEHPEAKLDGDSSELDEVVALALASLEGYAQEHPEATLAGNPDALYAVITSVYTTLSEYAAQHPEAKLGGTAQPFAVVLSSVLTKLGEYDKETADSELNATDNATGVIAGVQSALAGLKDKTITINVQMGSGVHLSPTGGEHGGGVGGHFASGTIDAPGGLSLVNELGPEIIAQDGRAFVANGGNPGIVELKPHAIVFDAADTRQILAGHSLTGAGIMSNAAPRISNTHVEPVGEILDEIKLNDRKKKGGGGGGKDTTDWWAIIEAHYKYVKETAEHAIKQLDYQIKVLKNAWEDEKTPIQEQIDALKEINETISRQITLIKRERDAALKPLDDEIDALKKAKETQDEQLELAEKQKAVEEAKAELETANQERTIRFFNKETGHWEWRADQERIADAEEKVKSAEKALADYEYEMQIRELERQRDALSAEYDEQIQVLEDQKLANEDTIYDLNQKLKDLEKKYQALIKPLEQEKDQRQRALEEAEYEWSELEFKRREKAEGSLAEAVSHTGKNGKTANSIISEVKTDMKDIKAAFSGTDRDAIAAIIAAGIMYGPSSGADLNTSSISNIGGTDSHNQTVIINGLTVTGEAADKIIEAAGDLGIYAGE